MIDFMTITAENNIHTCCIEIRFSTTLASISGFDKIAVNKKVNGTTTWKKIYEKEVSDRDDLFFTLSDLLVIPYNSYVYSVDLILGSNPPSLTQMLDPVECSYEGLFVGNSDKQFIATASYETEAKLNTQVQYVNTLNGRTPYRVSNAETCYYTGSSSGLFLEVDMNTGKLIPDNNHMRSVSVADFLTDGTDKLLKTEEGQIWYVSIDETVDLPFNDRYMGMNGVQFNWTEVGDLPLAWVVES